MSSRLDRFRQTRLATLDLISDLTQEQIDFTPSPDTWSVGEVLDHLVRLDGLMREEFEVLTERGRAGRSALLFRRLSDFETTPGRIPRWTSPLLDALLVPLAVLLPRAVRQMILRRRIVPARSPYAVLPQRGRTLGDLRRDLQRMSDYVRGLSEDNPDVRVSRLYYYNPLTGLTNLLGLVTLLAGHESRHQEQIRENLSAQGLPALPSAKTQSCPSGVLTPP